MKHLLALALVVVSQLAYSQTSPAKNHPPLVVGPVSLNCVDKPCSAATVTANALGSGVNGPLTAQTGMTINIAKDNWWTGGDVGEVDGLNVLVRQNAPHSDSSGILINVQNQRHGFLSATEFSSSIVDPVKNVLTYGIDVQEGVLDHRKGDYIGAVYTAEFGKLAPCTAGQIGADAKYIYVCVAANTWKRSALSSF